MPDTPLVCLRCGSDAIVPDARLVDFADGNAKRTLVVGLMRKPDAMLFKDEVRVPLRAQVCGDCGFTELYATDPSALWNAHLDRSEREWECDR